MQGNQRIERLLSKMTVEEKIGQLNLEPNGPDLSAEDVRTGKVGNVVCAVTAFAGSHRQERVKASQVNELQRVAKEESRLGIPLLVGRDVVHGHLTVAPTPLGQAASWSPSAVREAAKAASREARADGINWIYAPMLDVARDPRWGRVAEGYGEDPFLCSSLARAAVEGLQNPSKGNPTVAGCAKHYVGYSAAEGGRDYNTAEISLYTLRNIYMPSFKAAVDAGVCSVMTCFSDLGGVPVTSDAQLVRQVLKEEWGFDGFTVSDWNAIAELMEHRVAACPRNAAELALRAGVDMDMVARAYSSELGDLVRTGAVSMDLIDDSVRRVLRIKDRLGLFEDPYTDVSLAAKEHLSEANKRAVLELARKSIVLLENKGGTLPLTVQSKRIGLFGPLVEERVALMGTWCVDGQATDVVTLREAMEGEFGKRLTAVSALADECISQARHCDVAVVAVGEYAQRSGEAASVASIELPPGQLELIEGLKRVGVPLVVVCFAGRPLALTKAAELANALLFAWHPGTLGAIAIAEILAGKTIPSGRLPITFPRTTGQIPIYYNHRSTGRPLDPWSRGESRYLDERDAPLYPFGYGLCYGEVAYSDFQIARSGNGFRVGCRIENRAGAAFEEVAQLYVRDCVASASRPVRELKGFERVNLEAKQTKLVEFELAEEHLGFFGPDGKWRLEKGAFEVWIGRDSRAGLGAQLNL